MIWDVRFVILDVGFVILDVGFVIWDVGFVILDVGFVIFGGSMMWGVELAVELIVQEGLVVEGFALRMGPGGMGLVGAGDVGGCSVSLQSECD